MTNLDPKKVVLGMSGGVDSSISLMLLKKAGYQVTGVSLKYDVYNCSKRNENVCCSKESFNSAKEICNHYGFEHVLINVSDEFKREVIDYFKNDLKNNRTPSPCVFCNPKVKFNALLNYADKIGAKFVATGHYAKIIQDEFEDEKQFLLKKAKDLSKDQTYSLSFLDKNVLGRIIFPLADITKSEVYLLVQEEKIFERYKSIKQSQDFCFLNSDELEGFIDKEISPLEGDIINEDGKKIGKHKGLSHYTIGQRKGIKLPEGPFYVVEKKEPNTLVVSKDQHLSFRANAILSPYNLLVDLKKKNYTVFAKTRSTESLREAALEIEKDHILINFEQASSALVPGQIAVFYLDDICLGSGVIN